ncbi:MAG: RNA polymerase sigma-70 factor (ECF subfamily) [Planctomycetota bacterium]|jgi:RNA polymerase sigma-70 factor (ECF subfamily)
MDANEDSSKDFGKLMEAAKAGDQAALDEILLLTELRLRRVVDRRLGPKLRASLRRSDVLQNSYLAMLDALPRFEGDNPDDFVAWVARMIENDIRRQNRWFGAGKRKAPSSTSQRNLLAGILCQPIPTPSVEMSRNEDRLAVREAMCRLEADHARVIELSVFEELTHREIAEEMGRTEGACRMLLLRARTALALELERLSMDE